MLLKKKKEWLIFGLLLQIPNIAILLIAFFIFGIPYILNNISTIFIISGLTIFGLVNIFSIIFLVVGFTTKEKKIKEGDYY